MARDGEWKALRDALVEAAEGPQTVEGHVGGWFLSGGGLDQLECTLGTLKPRFV